ncbi:DUF1178 family protein [Sphingomonas sp. SUN019]|uniref:DUF1178 family protein n=1 Tax=Sphingomonas sp. SUN019 TaxID=2937788 RepID=UPI00216463D8|nr:DUF1178 family protein [Sphingomonas sp. SUN019]UVO52055.1 DUF1178 family protein [Sphingomonas sp. SUN019]
MIVFDLRCDGGHVFEAWFASSTAWEDQRTRGLVACPICGATDVAKAVMAPRVSAKGNSNDAPPPARVKEMLNALAAAQAKALDGSRWVGRKFAEEARAIHDGDRPHETIHGQATIAEAKALADDGVPVAPLPLPITPPDATN